MTIDRLKQILDARVAQFEQPAFIAQDPVSIPHAFDDPRDQEVIGFYAALLAWGRRDIVLKKMAELCERMEYRPYRFVYSFEDSGQHERLQGFKHRTFQSVDAIGLTLVLSRVLQKFGSIEAAFASYVSADAPDVGCALEGFSQLLRTLGTDVPSRVWKHVSRPSSGSACKRLNMYLRWMVRPGPVDLGIWQTIRPHQLLLPLDVHVGRQARAWGLLQRKANDWKAVQELTERCRMLDARDPVRYDFALFGSAIYGERLPADIA